VTGLRRREQGRLVYGQAFVDMTSRHVTLRDHVLSGGYAT